MGSGAVSWRILQAPPGDGANPVSIARSIPTMASIVNWPIAGKVRSLPKRTHARVRIFWCQTDRQEVASANDALPRRLRSWIRKSPSEHLIYLGCGHFCNVSAQPLEILIGDRNGFAMLSQCRCAASAPKRNPCREELVIFAPHTLSGCNATLGADLKTQSGS